MVGLCYQWLNGCSSKRAEPEVPEDAERAAGGTEPTQVWHNNSNVSGWVHVHILSVHNDIYCVCDCGFFFGGGGASMCPSLSDLVLAIYT